MDQIPATAAQGGSQDLLQGPLREAFVAFLGGKSGRGAANHIAGVPETGPNNVGGATPSYFPDPDNGEVMWGCYAWPHEARSTGNRVFFVNQQGRLLQTANEADAARTALFYDGPGGGPAYDAALSDMLGDPKSTPITGMGALLGAPPRNANDGNVWTRIRDLLGTESGTESHLFYPFSPGKNG